MRAATNSLVVRFPAGSTTDEVRQELSAFGDISLLKAASDGFSVSYFDSRNAAAAAAALGTRATKAPQFGERSGQLQKHEHIDTSLLAGIQSLSDDGNGRCKIEFFDVRMAERALRL